MVHALKIVRDALSSGGCLISIQDLPVPNVIEVHSGGKSMRVGWLQSKADFMEERSAYAALIRVVQDGLFILEDEEDFDFRIYWDGIKELQDCLADNWESSYIPDITLKRIEDVTSNPDLPYKVVLKSPARMTKLRVG